MCKAVTFRGITGHVRRNTQIPEAQQALIFEPFRQIDMSDTRKYEGTGLGLAIAHQIIQEHQGKIEVQSSKGSGTTFLVNLPGYHPQGSLPPQPQRVTPHP